MSITIATILAILSLCFGTFFMAYGVKAGLVKKDILASHSGDRETGNKAKARGTFYLFIGLFFLGGAVINFCFLYKSLF